MTDSSLRQEILSRRDSPTAPSMDEGRSNILDADVDEEQAEQTHSVDLFDPYAKYFVSQNRRNEFQKFLEDRSYIASETDGA